MRRFKNIAAIAVLCITAFIFNAAAQAVKPAPPKPKIQKQGDVYLSVDRAPAFPGGLAAFGKYLAGSVRYPAIDRKNNLQGKVFLTFIVERDGSVSNVEAVRGPSETLKAEGIRVMEASPKWVPGKQNGNLVRVKYTVPINFALGNEVKQ